MATYFARKSGNVNATDVWATTPSGTAGDFFSSFTSQDTLISNNFTITLNVNTTVLEIRNDATGGATAGGSFTLNSAVNLIANIYAGSTICVNYSASGSSTIIGNIYAPTGSSTTTVNITGTGTINIISTIYGGTSNSGCVSNTTATVNITGNVYGGSGANASAVAINNSGTVNITGNVYGGSGGGNPPSGGVGNFSNTGIINIIGNVFGGTVSNIPGLISWSLGPINVIGIITGGVVGPGAVVYGGGTLTATRAKGNGFGPGSVGLGSVVGIANNQTGSVKVYEIEYGDLGQSPTSGPIELVTANSNVAVFAVRLSTKKTLVDLNNATNLIPASGNVRSGISYNYGNNTGSCVIPNSNSVVYGVPVDNTVGSGLLSPVAVWNALTSSIGTSGSIGERLKNVSTVATVGKQFEGVL